MRFNLSTSTVERNVLVHNLTLQQQEIIVSNLHLPVTPPLILEHQYFTIELLQGYIRSSRWSYAQAILAFNRLQYHSNKMGRLLLSLFCVGLAVVHGAPCHRQNLEFPDLPPEERWLGVVGYRTAISQSGDL